MIKNGNGIAKTQRRKASGKKRTKNLQGASFDFVFVFVAGNTSRLRAFAFKTSACLMEAR